LRYKVRQYRWCGVVSEIIKLAKAKFSISLTQTLRHRRQHSYDHRLLSFTIAKANISEKSPSTHHQHLKMQQAVFVTEIGKPLTLGTRAIPEPKEGEVQIKVLSTLRLFHLSSSFSSND
jgi:hypothetical protein